MKQVLFSLLSIVLIPVGYGQDVPERNHPKQLKVLERFLGTWEHVVTLKHPGGGRDSVQNTESKRSWSHGGAFLRIEDVNWEKPQFDEFQLLLTYDVLEKTYTGVIMDGPDLMQLTATWDEESEAMTFDGKGVGGNLKYTVRFLSEDEARATGTFTNPEGEVMAEITWEQKRKAGSEG